MVDLGATNQDTDKVKNYCVMYAEAEEVTITIDENGRTYHFLGTTITEDKLKEECLEK